LFNPLLLEASFGPTPCTLRARRHDDTVVLTGPNSGGKTRLLQALALAQLLAQSGFFVPAREARLVWAEAMFLSISEGSHAGQREGRLGMELMRIRSVFESAKVGAFVVVDELCSGTNPGEGEEIFEMVLGLLRELGTQAFISTHFLQFAEGLFSSSERVARYGLSFWQVELDSVLAPTYQFVAGVARSSLAQLTASRLGVTREELGVLVERHKRASAQQRASTLRSRGEEPRLRLRGEEPRLRLRGEEPRAASGTSGALPGAPGKGAPFDEPPATRKASPA
jgi:DNA mismatch repair protein MutS2